MLTYCDRALYSVNSGLFYHVIIVTPRFPHPTHHLRALWWISCWRDEDGPFWCGWYCIRNWLADSRSPTVPDALPSASKETSQIWISVGKSVGDVLLCVNKTHSFDNKLIFHSNLLTLWQFCGLHIHVENLELKPLNSVYISQWLKCVMLTFFPFLVHHIWRGAGTRGGHLFPYFLS